MFYKYYGPFMFFYWRNNRASSGYWPRHWLDFV